MTKKKKSYCIISVLFAVAVVSLVLCVFMRAETTVYAAEAGNAGIGDTAGGTGIGGADNDGTGNSFSVNFNGDDVTLSSTVRMLLVLTILMLAPSLLIMLTGYTRIIIVLHFLRTAIGTQTAPPNQILIGLALFLTFFIMWPTFSEINEKALKPLDEGQISIEQALSEAEMPIRTFMYRDMQVRDLRLFMDISGEVYPELENAEDYDEIPFTLIVPAFIIGELRQAFEMGFLIYIPFIVIDMVVSSVLMSMGMMMLPPTTISLPFKILLFILADGWNLVLGEIVKTFY